MRNLIDKLMLLESNGTLSIPAIAEMLNQGFDKNEIYFRYRQKVNLPLHFEEGTITIIRYELFEVFSRNENGHLEFAYPTTHIDFRLSFFEPLLNNEDNRKIIGDNAIKKFNQLFGTNTADYIKVDKKEHFNTFVVEIHYPEDFLKLFNDAYKYRRDTQADI